ncbi:sulfotransferase family cytosolic 1B member 1-like [Tropilaelaps mercedesae]|uniref:Sulfotransferase family cytosolic 1B member 1-like n=1 Tax=Tropilaelaps mercedesae TaxID=418985 RepID=A0A1V9XHR1_9ACAR|nr:sulfotransferase family cytosolic 1B member 1-like [Tropilaelaps mercedesae]
MDAPPPVFAFRLQRGVKIPLLGQSDGRYADRLNNRPKDGAVVICAYPSSGEDVVKKIVLSLSPELGAAPSNEEQDQAEVDGDWNDASGSHVCVSFFYYYNEIFRRMYGRQPEENCSFNTFYRLFVAGKVAFGDYFVHLRSWLERTCVPGCVCDRPDAANGANDSANLLVLTYEDLEGDFCLNVHRLAEFLGAFDDSGDEGREQTIRRTQRLLFRSSSVDSADGCNGGRKMGLAGGWESHFSREHRNDFDEWIRWNGNASIYNKFWFDAL